MTWPPVLRDYWLIDPLPMAPADPSTMAYWRWHSALTLAARRV